MKEKQLKDRTKKDYLLEKIIFARFANGLHIGIFIQGKAIGFAPLPLESSTKIGWNDFWTSIHIHDKFIYIL